MDQLNKKNQFERNVYQRAADNCFKDLIKVLDKMKIKYWLEAGTCLGAIREGDFVAHDSDIDIGLQDIDKADELFNELFKAGFHYIHTFGKKDNGYEFSHSKHGVKVDFFFFYEDGDTMWHSAWQGDHQLFYDYPKELFKDLKEIEFRGLKTFVPSPPEKYLEIKYGDWKTPVKDWDWANSPKNKRV